MVGAFFHGEAVMTIHTVPSLRAKRHRLETRLEKAELVKQAMRDGAALHLQYERGSPVWVLSTGRPVSNYVAQLVIASASVVSVGDALFDNVRSQTYRWWSADAEEPAV
jgi:hypothetical protein